jgi:hypothetical protein
MVILRFVRCFKALYGGIRTSVVSKSKPNHYSDEELKEIERQWLKQKTRIDADPVFGYYFDRENEYERHFKNVNLRILFRHAARLRRQLIEGEDIQFYPKEAELVSRVYDRMVKNGYYSRSKEEEKKVRAWLGKIVSRQYYRKLKKK